MIEEIVIRYTAGVKRFLIPTVVNHHEESYYLENAEYSSSFKRYSATYKLGGETDEGQ